jgi:transcription elongation factor GreB
MSKETGSKDRGHKIYMTPQGAERLRSELTRLLEVERPEVVRTVSWAASNGDRSENADYIYGKRRLREIDRRIRFLTQRLEGATVVDPEAQSSDKVLFGATVDVEDEDGNTRTYCIVGEDESAPQRGWISWVSPLGRALLQHKAGDLVVAATPRGKQELLILAIRYEPIREQTQTTTKERFDVSSD